MAKPLQSWRDKGIDIAAWESKHGVSFTFRKTYKDKTTGEYKETRYFYPEDMQRLAELLVQTMEWVNNAVKVEPAPQADTDDIPF